MKFELVFLTIVLLACNNSPGDQQNHSSHTANTVATDTVKGSPHRVAMANIGKAHVHVEYNAPAVRNRIIWGGLVPFNEVWVTGAHNATSFDFSSDVRISGKILPKGKYGFFTIPGKEEWTLILNRNWKQHLTDDYSEKDDVLRWKVKPDSTEHTERLSYYVIPTDKNSGVINFAWEKVKISVPVEQPK
jgi:hypothetical protein